MPNIFILFNRHNPLPFLPKRTHTPMERREHERVEKGEREPRPATVQSVSPPSPLSATCTAIHARRSLIQPPSLLSREGRRRRWRKEEPRESQERREPLLRHRSASITAEPPCCC
ncbi:hypothetical protein S245_055972 [Arachis hypogaea]|nr:uncharacterized protein DS421_16g545350 [Arachis hypogaea]